MLSLHNMRSRRLSCFCTTFLFPIFLAACGQQAAPRLSINADQRETAVSASSPSTETAQTDLSPPSTPPSDAVPSTADAAPLQPTSIDPATVSAKGDPREWWEAIYAYGTKIGWSHTKISDAQQAGQKLHQIDCENRISVDRQGQQTAIDILTSSTETSDGELLTFRTDMTSGASKTQTTGRVEDGHLRLETTTSGKTTEETLPWSLGTLGFSATEESLAAAPLLPGGTRSLHALMPATNEIVAIDLVAGKYESTPLVDHTEDLLRINCAITLPIQSNSDHSPVIHSELWTNREGQVLKTSLAALHQETYRTTESVALAQSGSRRLDLVTDNTVPVTQSLSNPHGTKRIKYRVRLTSDDPARAFASGGSQQVTSLDPHTAEITVRKIELSPSTVVVENSSAVSRLPSADDRAPNNLIQSDDEQVLALAKTVAPDESDPAKLAVALEKYVNQIVTLKNFSQAFDTAAEVARRREGDCTEHSVLLAALARARGIPARVAIGLVYQPATQSFVYHMWNELWIVDHWVPMDATLGRGGIGAAHLKLTDSNLAGAQAYSCFLPVAQVIGQLQIEILEVE
jgi:hypothetical protein